jgi:hypothetical protein
MVSIPTEAEFKDLANIAVPDHVSREEERMIEGDERDAQIEAHMATLDPEEKEKVDDFLKNSKDPKNAEKVVDESKLTPAQIRKRRKKMENTDERKKKRLERLERKQDRLEKIKETLQSDLPHEEKEQKIKEIEGKVKPKVPTEEVKVEEAKSVGRKWTLSIALPGSILDNAQSPELR